MAARGYALYNYDLQCTYGMSRNETHTWRERWGKRSVRVVLLFNNAIVLQGRRCSGYSYRRTERAEMESDHVSVYGTRERVLAGRAVYHRNPAVWGI